MTDETDETIVVFCWYQPAEWARLKQIAADKEMLDDTYEEWKTNANQAIQDLHVQARKVQKISIKVDQLALWCKSENIENNMAARSRYAVVVHDERN